MKPFTLSEARSAESNGCGGSPKPEQHVLQAQELPSLRPAPAPFDALRVNGVSSASHPSAAVLDPLPAARWNVALASARGSEHAQRLLRNNQDAVAACGRADRIAIAVADGCSEGAFSEVGARLVVRFLTHRACESARWGSELAAEVTDALVAWLYTLARGCGELAAFIQEQLLTTFLCGVARGEQTLVFGVGDGVVHIDGETRVLDSGPDNAPAYVAYRMLPLGGAPLTVHHCGPARRIALATDGLCAKPELLNGAFDWKNPLTLQRQLNIARGLSDDTTLALLSAV